MQVDVAFPAAWDAARAAAGDRPLVFDAFLFFQELDILEIRLHELADSVDLFVLVEAAETFQGDAKPFHFEENRARFAPFLDKIATVRVSGSHEPGPYATRRYGGKGYAGELPWVRRGAQCNALIDGLVHARPTDWVMLSDLDEIPRAEMVRRVAADPLFRRGIYIFENEVYKTCLDLRLKSDAPWCGTKMIERRFLTSMQDLRMVRHEAHAKAPLPWLSWRTRTFWDLGALVFPQRLPCAGWHLTSIGDLDMLMEKYLALASGNHRKKAPEKLRAGLQSRIDAAARGTDDAFERAPLEELPAHVRRHPERFAHLMVDHIATRAPERA